MILKNKTIKRRVLSLYKKDWFRAAIRTFTYVPPNKIHIFIVGCYNSGTTLLDSILAEHKDISNLPSEGQALTREIRSPEDFGWNRMWHMCREQLEISKLDKEPNVTNVKKEWAFWFDRRKKFWLEKSIINSLNIDWFEYNFGKPYFIWIVRNGYAVSEGIQRRTKTKGKHPKIYSNGYPIDLCAKQWVVNNNVIEEKLKKVSHYIKISYEELTEDTSNTVTRILNWLPVKDKEIKISNNFIFHKENKPIINMNHKSIDRLNKNNIREINEVGREMLIRYNYNIIEE